MLNGVHISTTKDTPGIGIAPCARTAVWPLVVGAKDFSQNQIEGYRRVEIHPERQMSFVLQ